MNKVTLSIVALSTGTVAFGAAPAAAAPNTMPMMSFGRPIEPPGRFHGVPVTPQPPLGVVVRPGPVVGVHGVVVQPDPPTTIINN